MKFTGEAMRTALLAAVLFCGVTAVAQEVVPTPPPAPVPPPPRPPLSVPGDGLGLRGGDDVAAEKGSSAAKRGSSPSRLETSEPAKPMPRNPPGGFRDPTQASPLLRSLLDSSKAQSERPELPVIELKGRITGGLRPAAALLAIDKHFYLVRVGSEITLTGPRSSGQTLRVVEVTNSEVRLQVAPTGRSVVLY